MMLNTRPMVRALRFMSLAAAALLVCGPARAGGTNTYKFTNKEAAKAYDLHIEFDGVIQWNIDDHTYGWQDPAATFKSTEGSGEKRADLEVGSGGTGVERDASVSLTFGYPGATKPQVLNWYWTNEEHQRIGNIKTPSDTEGKFEYASVTSGGGMYLVVSHGEQRMFQTVPGQTALQTAQRMAFEINTFMNFASAYVDSTRSVRLVFQGTAFGEPCEDYTIMVVRDDPAGPLVISRRVNCPGDLNGDGLVDFGDYLEFLNLYGAGDPGADLNEDGEVDFSDYLEFLNLYDAGCAPLAPLCI